MTKVNHDLRVNDGGTIYHIGEIDGALGQGNLQVPNIFEESITALYPIGTKFVNGERSYRYCHFTTAITYMLSGVLGYAGADATYGRPPTYDASQAAGVGTVANPLKFDGTSLNLPIKNYYAGAYFIPWVTTTLGNSAMRIVSSTASALDSTYTSQYTVECVLEQPTPMVIAANTATDIFLSRYSDVRDAHAGGSTKHPFVGVPARIMTDEYYGWVQTWGPVFIVHAVADAIGDTANWRTVVFWADGSLRAIHESDALSSSHQIAGYTLAINGVGSEWTHLTLDP